VKKFALPFLLYVCLAIPLVLQIFPLQVLKLKIFDYLIEQPAPSGNFVVLNLTEELIQSEGGWPLPRNRLAEIHEQLLQNGAIGVGWVLSFVDEDRFGGDDKFATILKNNPPAVVATFEYANQEYPTPTGTVVLGKDVPGINLQGHLPNIPKIAASTEQGVVSAPVDVDSLLRQIPLLYKTPDGWVPSFGTQVYKAIFGVQTYIIKTNDNGISEISIRGIPPVKTDSYGRKWISWVDTPQTTLSEMNVQDKFVFVGVTAKGVYPKVATPVGLLEAHKIQAALAESILIADSPYIPDWHLLAELLILGIFVASVWLTINFLSIGKGLGLVAILLFTTGLSGAFSVQKGILLDFSWTFVSEILVSTIAYYINFQKQYKLRREIKKQFEHYLDPRQVKQLQDNPELLKLGGERKYCTFLFTDVRGFTSLSERLEPEEVTKIMNKALTIQVNAIQQNGGMIDKFIGDACMGIFSAPIDLPEHENRAIAAALKIQEDMEKADLGIEIGIGINSGEAIIGNMGSDTRFDYTAIGSDVNLAARCESSCKDVGKNIVIAKNTAQATNMPLIKLQPISMKGIKELVEIWTVKK
tara:strand:- start:1656 stop:3407 length:1752 start_codon:yes stop_codon:yes gene_type:complete